jgi:hypothetical protein
MEDSNEVEESSYLNDHTLNVNDQTYRSNRSPNKFRNNGFRKKVLKKIAPVSPVSRRVGGYGIAVLHRRSHHV